MKNSVKMENSVEKAFLLIKIHLLGVNGDLGVNFLLEFAVFPLLLLLIEDHLIVHLDGRLCREQAQRLQ